MKMGERIKELRKKSGMTQEELGKLIGVQKSAIRKYESGMVENIPQSSIRIMAKHFGVKPSFLMGYDDDPTSTSTAASLAVRMARDPMFAEQVQKRGVRIPVYGNVAAGIPIEAITDIEDYEEISQEMAAKGEYAALRIHGDSMEPKMSEGDVVIVRLQETIESGETAIVMINGGDATCKKIMRTDEGIMLIATNPKYAPMFYSNKQIEELPVRIWGKVVELRAKF